MKINVGDFVKLNSEKRYAFTDYGWEHYGNRPLKVIHSSDTSIDIPSWNGRGKVTLGMPFVVPMEAFLVGIEEMI